MRPSREDVERFNTLHTSIENLGGEVTATPKQLKAAGRLRDLVMATSTEPPGVTRRMTDRHGERTTMSVFLANNNLSATIQSTTHNEEAIVRMTLEDLVLSARDLNLMW